VLSHLSVKNFTLVDELQLELNQGMTALTGETGAGKSILLDALGLTLGDRAYGDQVKHGRDRADICASFDISGIPAAQAWLEAHELLQEGDCLLRRVVTKEGRSRGFINGQAAPLQQLRELGEMLIDIHSQHAHQSLLKAETHSRLLDDFAGNQSLLKQCRENFRDWQQKHSLFTQVRDNFEEISARAQLLRYQVQELDALALEDGELARLESEQRQLANAEQTLLHSQEISQLCEDDESGLLQLLQRALHKLSVIKDKPENLSAAEELMLSAQLQLQEAQSEISHHIDSFEMDPQRLQWVDDRLSSCFELARKHRIQAEELLDFHQRLSDELGQLDGGDERLDQLQLDAEAAQVLFSEAATKLSGKRQTAAKRLAKKINEQLQKLSMKSASFTIALNASNKPTAQGIDEIEFLISTNPGQPHKPMGKVASGGELSRISLAIQVVTAQSSCTPTLVFDEVDVGIGGATADIVGQLLRSLGEQGQVLCVTHLPQVASKAHQHLQVHKQTGSSSAQTQLTELVDDAKVTEIARMLGGEQLTQQTMAHAKEMLELATLH